MGRIIWRMHWFFDFFIFTNHHHPQPDAFVSQHSLNQVDATIAWAQQVCNGTACMQQLAIFPTEVWVKVAAPTETCIMRIKNTGCIGALSISYLYHRGGSDNQLAVEESSAATI